MTEDNKTILQAANAAVARGDYEGFLSFCADDTEWTFVGEQTLRGKQAVRRWMTTSYIEPPENMVATLIAEGDFVTAVGEIIVKNADGTPEHFSYCDVWRFRDGKMAELHAFVIKTDAQDNATSADK